jgi:drug/metabolite transporter (DMT)-like permease
MENVMSLTLAVGVIFLLSAIMGTIFFEFYYFPNNEVLKMPFIEVGWPDLTILVLCFAIFCSFLNLLGNLSLAKAYQSAESTFLAPLDYSYLIFATLWSKIIFDIWPSSMNFIGLFLIAFSGILIAWREKVKQNI